MPELPEVETVVRGLRECIQDKIIEKVLHLAPHIRAMNPRTIAGKLTGKKFIDIGRIGKHIFIELNDGSLIRVHLRMTGQLMYLPQPPVDDRHNHVILALRDSSMKLIFRDVRKFGYFQCIDRKIRQDFFDNLNLGPDALRMDRDDFIREIRSRSRMVKPLLLDQAIIAGLGNIYVDEILIKTRIHPRRISSTISRRKLSEMYDNMQLTLEQAIGNMGTTFDSFAGVNSEPGNNQSYLWSYNRTGKLCPICKKGRIRRIVVAQRGTHICPRCQKAPRRA